MQKMIEDTIAISVSLVFTLPIIFLSNIIRSWAIVKLWNWYIAYIFHIPQINIFVSFVFSVMVQIFTSGPIIETQNKSVSEILIKVGDRLVAYPVFAVIIGYLLLPLRP
jgi:hypothetical protein